MIERDSSGVAHIVGLSGGKDSVCMALALMEREPRPYSYVCTPTGDELPEMEAHWEKLQVILGHPIIRLTNGTLASITRENKMLPNVHARFCTRILKLRPFGKFIEEVQPAVVYIGLRADEEEREGTRPGGDSAALKTEVTQDFPMQRWGWGLDRVWEELSRRGVEIPERTDCARCPYQKLGEWYNLWLRHPGIYADAEGDEQEFKHTYRSATRDTWPAGLKELRQRFENGERPERSLRMMETRAGMCRQCSL